MGSIENAALGVPLGEYLAHDPAAPGKPGVSGAAAPAAAAGSAARPGAGAARLVVVVHIHVDRALGRNTEDQVDNFLELRQQLVELLAELFEGVGDLRRRALAVLAELQAEIVDVLDLFAVRVEQ